MTETAYKVFEQCIKDLKLHMEVEEFAQFVDENNLSDESVTAIGNLLAYIREKKRQKSVEIFKKLSRLPMKQPKLSAISVLMMSEEKILKNFVPFLICLLSMKTKILLSSESTA